MAIKKLPSTGDTPRSTGVPDSLVAGGAADSAGFPWAGRTFDHHETAFADDDGATPPALAAAVAAMRAAGEAYRADGADPAAIEGLAALRQEVITQLAKSRLLVPLLAEAGELGETPDGRIVEKTQELSIVTVASPDGRRVMPVFSSVEAMQRWNPGSRPIPVPGPQAAIAAAQEGTDLIIVDPGSLDSQFGVRRPELEAMALGTPTPPAWADPAVRQAFLEGAAGEPALRALALLPGDPVGDLTAPETEVHLLLEDGLDREALTELLGRLQDRWARVELIAERVDSMRFVPRAA
ncbi:type III secretion system (T3SS) SseB-like protein [Leucobacter komagatae]|uniref:Type III secretion system (T3SS) SseB-like protein n=1 Tax=Leucobacter komagatae TaxID=55969 RepID=A0A542Y4Y3_9MICO|nr:SseB family protein [Leucobacter komagatae]TQL43125.1 type III secretion system (T3SS) SseB-like protein [Leucobacter komagatae]